MLQKYLSKVKHKQIWNLFTKKTYKKGLRQFIFTVWVLGDKIMLLLRKLPVKIAENPTVRIKCRLLQVIHIILFFIFNHFNFFLVIYFIFWRVFRLKTHARGPAGLPLLACGPWLFLHWEKARGPHLPCRQGTVPRTVSNPEGTVPVARVFNLKILKNGPIKIISNNLIYPYTWCREYIMLDWCEREHEDMDGAAWNHQPSLDALRACELYKFWAIPGMRAQVDFLQWLVDRWSIQDHCFFIGGHQLKIEPADIYFLTGLPKRGEDMTLFGARPGGQSADSLRLEYCNSQARDKGIDIKTISRPELMVIAFTVTRLCEATALHIAIGSQMCMAVDCFWGTIFNWCDAVLANLKGQLIRAKNGQLKTFGYGALVVNFGLERVPMLILQHLTVGVGLPWEPKLMRWVTVMARHPDERAEVARFKLEYFQWLEK